MKNGNRYFKRILTIVLTIVMTFSGMESGVLSYAQESENNSEKSTSYENEKNALTEEQYKLFGLTTSSPELFGEDGSEEPLAEYEPLIYSELFVGYGNRGDKAEEHTVFMVMNETDTLSADAFNFDNMDDHLVGNRVEKYQSERRLQFRNSCPIDVDGDGSDEILETSLYRMADTEACYQDIQIYDLNEKNEWVSGSVLKYQLSKDKDKFLTYIEADTSKGYAALAVGDYDDDGKVEAAVYVPARMDSNNYARVVILEVGNDMSLTEKTSIAAKDFADDYEKNRFCYDLDEIDGKEADLLPIVNLMTTNISGRDDLVINVSSPLTDKIESDQSSSMGIYHYNNNKMDVCFMEDYMVYGSNRMRFNTAVQADVNGNGVEELIVGGYKNQDWDDAKDPGELSDSENLVQIYCWNETQNQYEAVWGSPKEVSAYDGNVELKINHEQMEPAAMAAGRLHSNTTSEQLFLEGVILKFSGGNSKKDTEKERLKDGYFEKEHSITLAGENHAFISTAVIATFSTASNLAEQLVVLVGDHKKIDDDQIYYDISWTWESSGKLTDQITNNDYINDEDEDDHGTFMSLCAINADNDTVYVEYTGKEYGWSAPELCCIIQSVPYWREIQYNSEGFGAGYTEFEVVTGTGNGYESDWAVGGGVFLDVSAMGGVGFLGTGGMTGGGAGLSVIAQYVNNYSESITKTDSYKKSVAAGKDYVVLYAVPVVTYNYNIWIPDQVVTDEAIKAYEEIRKNDPTLEPLKYNEGEIIAAHNEECSINVVLNASFTHMLLEEYNDLVKKFDDQGVETGLQVITENMLAEKTNGDPYSYPENEDQLKQPGNVENLFVSSAANVITGGDVDTTIGYNVTEETQNSDGYHVDGDIEGYWKAKAGISFIVNADIEWEVGAKGAAGGGESWITSGSNGLSFSSTVKDLPEGTADAYEFNSRFAVYNIKVPTGGDHLDMPYVIGYLVNLEDEEKLPPGLPDDLHVLAATDKEIMLRWEAVTGIRKAESYAVYEKDNISEWQLIGVTNLPYYKVTNLNANTQYQFALVSYSEKDGKGNKSIMSAPLTAVTAESSASVPSFVTQPQSVVVNPGVDSAKSFSAEAVLGEGMEEVGAKLTYQWQKYNPNVQDRLGAWENIEGATSTSLTLPTITEEDGKYKGSDGETYDEHTRYRLIATQTWGGDIHSVYSNSVSMFISDKQVEIKETTLELSIELQDGVVTLDKETGQVNFVSVDEVNTITCNALLKCEDNTTFAEERDVLLIQRTSEGIEKELAKGTTDSNGKVEFEINVSEINFSDELYALYKGELNTDEETILCYMPSTSSVLPLHYTKKYSINYKLDDGFNDVKNPRVMTNHSAVTMLYSASRPGYVFKGWKLADGTPITEINPNDLTENLTVYAQWEKAADDSSSPADPSNPSEPTNPSDGENGNSGNAAGNNQNSGVNQKNEKLDTSSVNTGDDTNLLVWCFACIMAMIVVAVVWKQRRKNINQ